MRCSWLCGISRSFLLLSPAQGQVTYVLLTRSPLISKRDSFDLHVLGTPPAFILSQDQTLHKILFLWKLLFSFLLWCIFFRIVVVINSLGLLIVILFSFQRPSHFNFFRYCAFLVYHILCYTVNYFFKFFISYFVARSNLLDSQRVLFYSFLIPLSTLFLHIFLFLL